MVLQTSVSLYIPIDIQYLVLESADWEDQPILAQVCSAWRNFIRTSDTILEKRYQPIYDVSPAILLDNRQPTPKIHRALSGRHITLKSGYEFGPCYWNLPGNIQYKDQGTIHQKDNGINFFSSDPAVRLPRRANNSIDIVTRRADAWFQRNFGEGYPMSCTTVGRIPTVGWLLLGACKIAQNGYTDSDYTATCLRYWTQSFYDPVILGLSWQVERVLGSGPAYLDLRFDIQEVGTGRVEGPAAALLRRISPLFISWGPIAFHKLLIWRANAAHFLSSRVPYASHL
ncbi:hypothetical protein TWF718_000504 [Orbilia javanica]|uniref:F-box domain-containing protein n=1 Tax=Orbilia javanica TaxID=47235 RepID=A0AAN8RRP4_9PEZI